MKGVVPCRVQDEGRRRWERFFYLDSADARGALHESFGADGVTKKPRCTLRVHLRFFVTRSIQSIRTPYPRLTAQFRFTYLRVRWWPVVALVWFVSSSVCAGSRSSTSSILAPLAEISLLQDAVWAGRSAVLVGDRGHVMISSDQGHTWRQVLVPTRVMLTAICSTSAQHLWAVGHDAIILHSSNAGETWIEQYLDPGLESPLFDVWFENEKHGIAIGAYGLYLSTQDGGHRWRRHRIDEEEPHLFSVAHARDGTLYMVGEFGSIFVSTDKGAVWKRMDSPYQGTFFGVLELQDSSVLIFGLRGTVFRSSDKGKTWTQIVTGTKSGLFAGQEAEDGTVWLVGQSGSILSSKDGGQTFTVGNRGNRNAIGSLLLTDDGGLILVGEGGVQRVEPVHGP